MSGKAAEISSNGTLGALLRRYRAAAMLSQADLATRAALSTRAISDLERGIKTRPYPETLRRLADALHLDTADRSALYAAARPSQATPHPPKPIRPSGLAAFPALPPVGLIGREDEVAAIDALMRAEDVRLVTLTGTGGVGKTRLARAVAHGLADRFAAIVFVDLSPVREPWLVLPTVARVLGVDDTNGQGIAEALDTAIGDRHLLLVLDNLEQVVDAAVDLAALLTRCPHLKALVTSRVVLRIAAEHVFPVLPLPVPDATTPPDPATLLPIASVALFIERARAVAPEFALTSENAAGIAALTHHLDGVPLAIELAASWVPVLPLEVLLRRLERRLLLLVGGTRDAPARQRTMRDAIAWSYDLLEPGEQILFRRLSVFVGGFTLEGAEAITVDRDSVLMGIASLVAKSLVQRSSDGRYRMLETIREYGLEQLEASGEERTTRQAHAAWCLDLVHRGDGAGKDDSIIRWWDRLEAEQPNLRTVLEWMLAGGDVGGGQRMAAALAEFWWMRGNPREGRGWLEWALSAPADMTPQLRAILQTGLAEVLWAIGDYVRSLEHINEALEAWRAIGDEPGAAACLLRMAVVAHDLGDYTRAVQLYESSLEMYRALGDEFHVIRCQADLGLAVMHQGDLERATALQEEALALSRIYGDSTLVANGLFNLAEISRRLGDLRRAVALYRESLRRHWELRERKFVADDLLGIALVATALGRDEEAAWLAGVDETVREEIGARVTPDPERVAWERAMARVHARLGNATFARAKRAGREAGSSDAISVAIDTAGRLEALARSGSVGATPITTLSTREIEVLCLLTAGKSDREIGATLFISHRTVNGHVANIYTKLGVNTRAAAAAEAVRLGLLFEPPSEVGLEESRPREARWPSVKTGNRNR